MIVKWPFIPFLGLNVSWVSCFLLIDSDCIMPNIWSMEPKFQLSICWTIWKWNNMKIMGMCVAGIVKGRERMGMGCPHHFKHLDWLKFSLNLKAPSQWCVRDTTLLSLRVTLKHGSWKFHVSLPSSRSDSYFDLSVWISEYFEYCFVGGVLGPKCVQWKKSGKRDLVSFQSDS